ncbi:taurine catabolism dioxygenase TauD, TfdA family protein [Hesseltinella vesiculosa]|uniref:Taurine catabolism dioxygenase TauD, TfdA family protein n=1 Tax=Hesseltinella vesiculosa TaxID=101127 RepID=A0A1X2G8G6_9FUNG|nr:taurine catabolism dioxygenase TauD, TfdA family protein [Hesseltinella vesiculosa]
MPTAQIHNSSQPDITYLPDKKNWQARTARRLAEEDLPKDLPDGFPEKLDGPKLWTGSDYQDKESEWVYELNEQELNEIKAALQDFEDAETALNEISPEKFVLPTLGPKLKGLIQDNVVEGRGFLVVRGIDPDSYSRQQQVIVYAGVSSYVGTRGLQGKHVLAHITDLVTTKERDVQEIIAPAYTNDHQVFHTDAGDIISLFAIGVAEEGGRSKIASSWTVYNEIASTRPDLIHTLAEDWVFDHGGYGDYDSNSRPLLYYEDGKLIIQYARRNFTGFGLNPRSEDLSPISEAQAESLDTLHYLGEKHSLAIAFKKGDIQYINNLSIFHARDGYTDSEKNRRHLLRLWLHPENSWKIPEKLQHLWNTLYFKEREEHFPLEPTLRH